MEGVILLPLNHKKNRYQGFICSRGEEYFVEIASTEDFKDVSVDCDWKLKDRLRHRVHELEAKLKEFSDVEKFVSYLKHLLDEDGVESLKNTSVAYCTEVVSQIEKIGWDKVKDVNRGLTSVTLEAVDAGERRHTLKIHPPESFPRGTLSITVDLPLPFRPHPGLSTFSQIYEQFCELLPVYQRFWDHADELQCRCWVLEPESSSFAAKEYRIALTSSSSVLLRINPLHPENPPECQFLGAEATVMPIRERFMNNAQEWNGTLSLYQNLRNVLQLEFPAKNPNADLDVTLQCGICYTYRLQDELPEQACNEPRCGQLFHRQCLVEWIRSVPGAKQSFQTMFGECPYCNSAITVKLCTRK